MESINSFIILFSASYINSIQHNYILYDGSPLGARAARGGGAPSKVNIRVYFRAMLHAVEMFC